MKHIVVIGGISFSGKTTLVKSYVNQGYVELKSAEKIESLLKNDKNIVIDNWAPDFSTIKNREFLVKIAKDFNVPIHFVSMETSLEDAEFNLCCNMMEKKGLILNPNDFDFFSPSSFEDQISQYELPTVEEGFSSVKIEKFIRNYPNDWINEAAIFDFDGILRISLGEKKYPTNPKQVKVIKKRGNTLKRIKGLGVFLLGVSNQPGIEQGDLTKEIAELCFAETSKQLGVDFHDIIYCPHKETTNCHCRQPLPGMAVQLIWKYKLDPRKCMYVGDVSTKVFAQMCGFRFVDHMEFFK